MFFKMLNAFTTPILSNARFLSVGGTAVAYSHLPEVELNASVEIMRSLSLFGEGVSFVCMYSIHNGNR